MNRQDAIEEAILFAGMDFSMSTEDVTAVEDVEGTWKIELTSDITVFVAQDGECEFARW